MKENSKRKTQNAKPSLTHSNLQNGFTLIELIVVFAIMAILSTITIAGFANFNKTQVVQAVAFEFSSFLNLAKSRAFSQVKSSCPSSHYLKGYRIDLSIAENNYSLNIICSPDAATNASDYSLLIETNPVPAEINITASSTSFFFPVLSVNVEGAGAVVFSAQGASKAVIINSVGVIGIQ